MTKASDSPVTRETDSTDAQGNVIVVSLAGTSLGLRVKGKPREVFSIDYKKLLALAKCNQI